MPGPGAKKKKSKATGSAGNNASASASTSTLTPETWVGDIDKAEGWQSIILTLCDAQGIPDLNTRSGLKRVHADFDAIYRKLDRVYERYIDNDKVKGGIIGIYTKMCADSLLRNKLFKKGFLLRLIPLLDNDTTRNVAGRSLTNITHHGGIDVRMELAKLTPGLTRVLRTYPDDILNAEYVIVTLSHALGSIVTGEETTASRQILSTLDIKSTLNAVLVVLRRPDVTTPLLSHASELLAYSTFRCSKECQQIPSLLRFLVAGLRSTDWNHRATAIGGVFNLHALDSAKENADLDPNRFIAAFQAGLPDHLSELMMDYGVTETDTYIILKTQKDYQDAMMKVIQDADLYSLGLKLAEMILRTEYAIGVGAFQFEDPKTGKMISDSCGLPFTMWNESLPHCSKALREKGELDKADILDIKYWIMKQRVDKAVQIGKDGLKRNPSVAYFYYSISMAADATQGLRASKKGLKCKELTPFIRNQLMWRATEHAGWMGQRMLQDCGPTTETKKWEEGIAFLMSALDDAKAYVNSAPPDHRHMKGMLYWYIILTITIKGPTITPQLTELQRTFKQLKLAEEMATFTLSRPPAKTILWHCVDIIRTHYSDGVAEWDSVIKMLDKGLSPPVPTKDKVADDLAAWLDDVNLENEEHDHGHCVSPTRVFESNVELYRCSWCSNPSAVLRKCSGCNKTRYCDGDCQKQHWSKHKKSCASKA